MSRAWARAVAALALLAIFVGPALAAALDEYTSRVEEGILVLAELELSDEAAASFAVKLPIDRLRALFPAEEIVETADGPVTVDNRWLGRELDAYMGEPGAAARADRARAMRERLEAIELHLDLLSSAPGRDTMGETRSRLAEILERREFQEPSESWIAATVRKIKARLLELLEELLKFLFGGQQGSTLAVGVRSIILVAGVIALLLLVRVLARALTRRDPERRRGERTVLGETIGAGETAASLAAAARDLAAAGDYRGAIRKLFVALLYDLDERKLVPLEANATNREYLARVRALGRLYPIITVMTDSFERVWYGGATADRSDFDAFAAQHAEAVRLAAE
jgi:hypothetical protein